MPLLPNPAVRSTAGYFLCAASGILLGLMFDGVVEAEAASWFVLVPLLVICRFKRPGIAARHGFAFAFPMWLVSLWWMIQLRHNGGPLALVLLGLLGLGAYCAAYTALFAALFSRLWKRADTAPAVSDDTPNRPGGSPFRQIPVIVLTACLWCGAEYIRFNFLSGFAWNALGATQTTNLSVIQIASLGGVHAVSFIVVLFNAALAGVAVRMWRNIRRPGSDHRRHFDLMFALVLLLVTVSWGTRRANHLHSIERSSPTLAIAAANPNAPCVFSTDDDLCIDTWNNLVSNTVLFAKATRPDLFLWPETILPLNPGDMEPQMSALCEFTETPILAGGTEFIQTISSKLDNLRFTIYNSSFLFTPDGIVSSYRKRHLVPFGEFIPLDKTIPYLQRFAPTGVSVSPGTVAVLMPVVAKSSTTQPHPVAFVSPLICFEDTVASLSRDAVRLGADILLVQSNDAWFTGSNEARQHNNQAVFRAVENARPLVRCSNSGVMSVISSYGKVSEYDDLFMESVPILRDITTPYTRFGDRLFAIPCALIFCTMVLLTCRRTTDLLTRFFHSKQWKSS